MQELEYEEENILVLQYKAHQSILCSKLRT
jgi:hypothetical protein